MPLVTHELESESSSHSVSNRVYRLAVGMDCTVAVERELLVFGTAGGKGAAHSSGCQSILKPLYTERDMQQVLAKSALWIELVKT